MNSSNKEIYPLQKEIWLVKHDQLSVEIKKPFRPYLVISNNLQNQFDSQVIVLPLTTKEIKSSSVGVFIEKSEDNLLEKNCWILTNRIHTIDKKLRLVKKLGIVNHDMWLSILNSIWKSLLESNS